MYTQIISKWCINYANILIQTAKPFCSSGTEKHLVSYGIKRLLVPHICFMWEKVTECCESYYFTQYTDKLLLKGRSMIDKKIFV